MAMLATHTSSTLWKVERVTMPRSMMLAIPTSTETPAAHRQPPLSAKASTGPATHMDGSVGPTWSWASMYGESRIPAIPKAMSVTRKGSVQRAAEPTLRSVANVQVVRSSRKTSPGTGALYSS